MAKSAAVEVGKVWARYSSKVPVKPGSPAQVGHDAIARLTLRVEQADLGEVAGQLLDLDEHAGGLAVERVAADGEAVSP